MGFGGISAWQLGVLLVIVAIVFGTRRLRNVGGDLGAAVKGFREGVKDDGTDSEHIELGIGAADRPPVTQRR